MPNTDATAKLVAILFTAPAPLTKEELANACGLSPHQTAAVLGELPDHLEPIGMSLTSLAGKYKLVTSPAVADTVRAFLLAQSNTELSKAALETLAIVAYRGPISRSGIEEIRGVASDAMIRNLLSRGLITETNRDTKTRHAVTYAISHGFLEHFGLASPDQLPPVPELISEN